MEEAYPLEWFDTLIMSRLNAKANDTIQLMQPYCEEIKERANLESLKIKAQIKSQVFTTGKFEEIEIVVRQYHSSLIQLYDYALFHNHPVFSSGHLKSANSHVLSKIDEIISFIEYRFSKYLSPEDRVPQSYLSLTQSQIKEKMPLVEDKLYQLTDDPRIIAIILYRLHRFSSSAEQPFSVTFKNIHYKRELIKSLCELENDVPSGAWFTALDRLLIYFNYNSKGYIRNLVKVIHNNISKTESIRERIDLLSLSFKEFKQILHKPGVKLNPNFDDIHRVMNNWFNHEIAYYEKKLQLAERSSKKEPITPIVHDRAPVVKNKLECLLSTDQIALAFRAMYDSHLLKASSLSEVFKTTVPYLSTRNKDDISYRSMRSKSYSPEQRDREKIIEALEQLIKKIREY